MFDRIADIVSLAAARLKDNQPLSSAVRTRITPLKQISMLHAFGISRSENGYDVECICVPHELLVRPVIRSVEEWVKEQPFGEVEPSSPSAEPE